MADALDALFSQMKQSQAPPPTGGDALDSLFADMKKQPAAASHQIPPPAFPKGLPVPPYVKPGEELAEDEDEDYQTGGAFWDNPQQNKLAQQYNRELDAWKKRTGASNPPASTSPAVPGMELLGGTPPGPPKPPLPNAAGVLGVESLAPPTPQAPRFNPRTGLPMTPMPMGSVPILDAPVASARQVVAGAEQAAPGAEAFAADIGRSQMRAAGQNPPGQPQMTGAHGRELAGGAAKIVGGAMEATLPLVPAAALAAPLSTALTLAAGVAADKGTSAALKSFGVPEEYADLAGSIAAILAGYGAAHVKLTPEQTTLAETLRGTAADTNSTIDKLKAMVDRGGTENERNVAQAILARKYGIKYGPSPQAAAETVPPAETNPAAATGEPAEQPQTGPPAAPVAAAEPAQPANLAHLPVPPEIKKGASFETPGATYVVRGVTKTKNGSKVIYDVWEKGQEAVRGTMPLADFQAKLQQSAASSQPAPAAEVPPAAQPATETPAPVAETAPPGTETTSPIAEPTPAIPETNGDSLDEMLAGMRQTPVSEPVNPPATPESEVGTASQPKNEGASPEEKQPVSPMVLERLGNLESKQMDLLRRIDPKTGLLSTEDHRALEEVTARIAEILDEHNLRVQPERLLEPGELIAAARAEGIPVKAHGVTEAIRPEGESPQAISPATVPPAQPPVATGAAPQSAEPTVPTTEAISSVGNGDVNHPGNLSLPAPLPGTGTNRGPEQTLPQGNQPGVVRGPSEPGTGGPPAGHPQPVAGNALPNPLRPEASPIPINQVVTEAHRQEQFQLPRDGQSPEDALQHARDNTLTIEERGKADGGYVEADVPVSWLGLDSTHVDAERQGRLEALGGTNDPIFITEHPIIQDGKKVLVPINGNNRIQYAKDHGLPTVHAYVTRGAWDAMREAAEPEKTEQPHLQAQIDQHMQKAQALVDRARKEKSLKRARLLAEAQKETELAAALRDRAQNAAPEPLAPPAEKPTIEPEARNEQPVDTTEVGPGSPEGQGPLAEGPTENGGAAPATGETGSSSVVGNGPDEGSPSGPGAEGNGLQPSPGNEPPAGVSPGRGRSPRTPEQSATQQALEELRHHDYRITAADQLGEGGEKTKAKNNLEAIRILKKVEAEGRLATPEEQAQLVKYVGWGQLSAAFDPWKREWSGFQEDLKELLGHEEYEKARASTKNAHYTSPEVVAGMWDAMKHLGFVKPDADVLEPSMGIGHFFGLMPADLLPARRTGVEIDPLTGGIAKLLYPSANIQVMGFEKAALPNGYFDVAISNVPFGKYGVHDAKYKRTPFVTGAIHNYFFAKALDKVRPGGIVAFITSSFTMDAKSPTMRNYLADRADLIGAIRLPGGKKGAFAQNAGTEVTTDLIFLKKRAPQEPAAGEKWADTGTVAGIDENGKPTQIEVNEYYAKHPEMMLGQMALQGTMYGPDKSKVLLGEFTSEAMAAAIAKLPANVYSEYKEDSKAFEGNPIHELPNPGEIKDGGFGLKDGQIIVRTGDRYSSADLSANAAERVRGMIGVRSAVRNVFRTQLSDASEKEVEAARKQLNAVYDAFIKKHGPLNSKENLKAFFGDPDAPLLSSLEDYDRETNTAKKRQIFTQRTIERYKPIDKVEKPSEALAVSLAESGRIDWMRMQELTGRLPEEMQAELSEQGLIFRNPEGQRWETADEYLSGNVRAKLAVAENAAKTNPLYQPNVEALKVVQPKDLTPRQINANLGASWIPTADIRDFLAHLLFPDQAGWLRDEYLNEVQVGHAGVLGNWTVRLGDRVKSLAANTNKWGSGPYSGHQLAERALNLQNPVVNMEVPTDDGKGTKLVVDKKGTLAAQERLDKIRSEFKKWLWSDGERAVRLSRKYNDEFNNLRLREYNGAHLTFPGMARLGLRNQDLDPHQKNAVWRIIQNGNTLLAHVVGAGKTFEMIAAGMELRRMGLVKKPMYVVPNHLVEQWGADFMRLYPGANIFVAGKEHFTTGRRQAAMSRIATGNYDAVIVAHRSFQFLPVSDETFNGFMQEQLHDINQALADAEKDAREQEGSGGYGRRRGKGGKKNPTIKQLESAKARIEKQIEDRAKRESSDKTITFEELGVDHLFVDEAHAFKNLYFPTKMTRVAGLPNSQSDRAMDMFIKSQYLSRLHNGRRGVVFATGTPIMNTMAEMFTMQRYLQMEWLKEVGMQAFDSWAQNFGQARTGLELAPEGKGYRMNTRFDRFINVGELLTAFRSVADVKNAEDLNLPKPSLKTGKPIVIAVPSTPELRSHVESLGKRAEAIRSGKVRPDQDNMLAVVGSGRKAALDMRLINPSLPDHPTSKVNVAIDKIHQIWKETKPKRSTQTVFLDLSTPRGTPDVPKKGEEPDVQGENPSAEDTDSLSVYDDIRKKLIKRGVPAAEIKFIHDAKDDAAKQRLFDDMNSGRVRILLGSTEKMGAGMNAQKKMIALHHLDAPWRPGDLGQRNGRIERQGNENPEVQIYQYVTEDSFDAYMWQTLMSKAGTVAQAMSGDLSVREIEDVGMMQMTAAEAMAASSGNPEVRERIGVEMEVRKLEALKEAHEDELRNARMEVQRLPGNIAGLKREQREWQAIIAKRDAWPAAQEPWTVNAKGFEGKDAGERNKALTRLALRMKGDKENLTIGTYKGFEVVSSGRGTATYKEGNKEVTKELDPDIEVGGLSTWFQADVNDESGLRLANAVRHTIDSNPDRRLAEVTQEIVKSEGRFRDLQGELNTPFEQEQKLANLQARLKELDDKLDIGKQDTQAVLAGDEEAVGEPAEEAPARTQRREAPAIGTKGNAAKPSIRTTGEEIEPEDLRPVSSLDQNIPFEDQWSGNRAKPDADFVTDGAMMIEKSKIIDQPLAKEMEEGPYRSVDNGQLKAMYDKAVAGATKELREIGYATVKLAAKSPGMKAPEPSPYAYYADKDGKVYILDPDFVSLLQKATGGDTFYATPEGDRVILKREGEPTSLLMGVKPDRMPMPSLATIREKLGEFLSSESGEQNIPVAIDHIKDWLTQRFGDADAPKANYSGLGAKQSRYMPGGNLSQLEKADKTAHAAAVRAASARAQAATILRGSVPAITKALEGSGQTWDDLRLALIESRLRGIRDRWTMFQQQAENISDQDLENSFDEHFVGLLNAIEGKRGIPQNVAQAATALAQAKDWDTLRDFLSLTFEDAASNVARVMEEDQFHTIASNPQARKALQIYKDSVERPMAQNHALNEGVFSDALGPLDTYYPLVPVNRPMASAGPGRRLPYRKPKNMANAFATGLSESYDPGMEAFKERLSRAIRANDKAALIQSLQDAGWLTPIEPNQVDFVGPDDQTYRGERVELKPARLLIQNGKTIPIRASMGIMPKWLHQELAPILEGIPIDPTATNRIMRLLNTVALLGPADFVFHSSNLLGTLVANTPFLGTSLADKGLSAPLIKKFAALVKVLHLDPTTPESIKDLVQMAKLGMIPSRYASETLSKKFAEQLGAEFKGWSLGSIFGHEVVIPKGFGPALYGPKGLDIRTRLFMYRLAKEINPGASPQQLYHFVNQLGNYVPELQSTVERSLKSSGWSAFFTAGSTMIRNGVNAWLGTGPMPMEGNGLRLWQQLTGGGAIFLAIWALLYKEYTGKWPWQDRRAKFMYITANPADRQSKLGQALWGKGSDPGYISLGFFNPLILRGARAMGAPGAFEAKRQGGSNGQAWEAAQRDILNSFAHPALGPTARSLFVLGTGVEPYLTGFRDTTGRVGPQFYPAIPPKTKPGFSFTAQAARRASGELNAFFDNFGLATGLLAEPEDRSHQSQKGSNALRMITDLALPGLVGTSSNPYRKAEMLRRQRVGTR